eukprot:GHRQ01013013.1.p1 GENE.GHRQ01013013.1~~GHRQ01013013.1.p1  ORF type:complete len:164 (-),score=22.68 GHRQ01013013.1:279-770(-)
MRAASLSMMPPPLHKGHSQAPTPLQERHVAGPRVREELACRKHTTPAETAQGRGSINAAAAAAEAHVSLHHASMVLNASDWPSVSGCTRCMRNYSAWHRTCPVEKEFHQGPEGTSRLLRLLLILHHWQLLCPVPLCTGGTAASTALACCSSCLCGFASAYRLH